MKNIVLIGMPGCGKTRVGQALSRMLDMPLVDTDQMVVEEQGRSIPDIFARDGEAGFRELESAAARKAAALEGVIIATGGGMVLREENMAVLAKTGILFFRDRPLEDLLKVNHSGRPLNGKDGERVRMLYDQRIGLYRRYAHHTISHTDTVQEAAEQIAALYRKEEKG